jgi:hypothetical protein
VTASTCCGGARRCGWRGSSSRQGAPPSSGRSCSPISVPWRRSWPTRHLSSCSPCGATHAWSAPRRPGGWCALPAASSLRGEGLRGRRRTPAATETRTTTRRLARTRGQRSSRALGSPRGGSAHAADTPHRSLVAEARAAGSLRQGSHQLTSACYTSTVRTNTGCGHFLLAGPCHPRAAPRRPPPAPTGNIFGALHADRGRPSW